MFLQHFHDEKAVTNIQIIRIARLLCQKRRAEFALTWFGSVWLQIPGDGIVINSARLRTLPFWAPVSTTNADRAPGFVIGITSRCDMAGCSPSNHPATMGSTSKLLFDQLIVIDFAAFLPSVAVISARGDQHVQSGFIE